MQSVAKKLITEECPHVAKLRRNTIYLLKDMWSSEGSWDWEMVICERRKHATKVNK
jgi:hypothetical protein